MAVQAQLGSMVRPEPFRTVSFVIDVSFAEDRIRPRHSTLIALALGALHFVKLTRRLFSVGG